MSIAEKLALRCFNASELRIGWCERDLESLERLEHDLACLGSIIEAGDAVAFRQCLRVVNDKVSRVESVSLAASAKVAFTALAILRELLQGLGDKYILPNECVSGCSNLNRELQSELADVLLKVVLRCNRVISAREGLIPCTDLTNNNGLTAKRKVRGVSSVAILHDMEFIPLDSLSSKFLCSKQRDEESKRMSLLIRSMLCFTYSISMYSHPDRDVMNRCSTTSCLGKAVMDVVVGWEQESRTLSGCCSSSSSRTGGIAGRNLWKALTQAINCHMVEQFVTSVDTDNNSSVWPAWAKVLSCDTRHHKDGVHGDDGGRASKSREAALFKRDLAVVRTLLSVGSVFSTKILQSTVRSLSKRLVKATVECCSQAKAKAQARTQEENEMDRDGSRGMVGFRGLLCHLLECLVPLLCLSVAREYGGAWDCHFHGNCEDRMGTDRVKNPQGKRCCLERAMGAFTESLLLCENMIYAILSRSGVDEEAVKVLTTLRRLLLSTAGYVVLYFLSMQRQFLDRGQKHVYSGRILELIRGLFVARSDYSMRVSEQWERAERQQREEDGILLWRLQSVHPSLSLSLFSQLYPILGLVVSPQALDRLLTPSEADGCNRREAFATFNLTILISPWLMPEQTLDKGRLAKQRRIGSGIGSAGPAAVDARTMMQLPSSKQVQEEIRKIQGRFHAIRAYFQGCYEDQCDGCSGVSGSNSGDETWWWPQQQPQRRLEMVPSLCMNPHELTEAKLRRLREKVRQVYQAAISSTVCESKREGDDNEDDLIDMGADVHGSTVNVVEALHEWGDHGASSSILAHALTFLTHKRVCRLACVSKTFRAACSSSYLWLSLFVIKYGREGVYVGSSDERRNLLLPFVQQALSCSAMPSLFKIGTRNALSAESCSHCAFLRDLVKSGSLNTFRRAPVISSKSTACCPQLYLRHDWRTLFIHRVAAYRRLRLTQAHQSYLKDTRRLVITKGKRVKKEGEGRQRRTGVLSYKPNVCLALGCNAVLTTLTQARHHAAEHMKNDNTNNKKAITAKAKAKKKK